MVHPSSLYVVPLVIHPFVLVVLSLEFNPSKRPILHNQVKCIAAATINAPSARQIASAHRIKARIPRYNSNIEMYKVFIC